MNNFQIQGLGRFIKKMAVSNRAGYAFSACIEYQGKLYFGVNEVTSMDDPTAHAEIQIIRYVCKRFKTHKLEGAVIYSSGEPCPMCLTAIAWAGIKKVYYVDSWVFARENNEFYDIDSVQVNEFLDLKLEIHHIGIYK